MSAHPLAQAPVNSLDRWTLVLSRARSAQGPVSSVVLAGVIFACALAARFGLEGTLPPGYPFLTFFPAVILTTFVGGTRAGTLCAVLCGLAAWYWFIPPTGFVLDRQSAFALLFYVFIVVVDIALIHAMTKAMRRLEVEKGVSTALAEQQRTMFEELQHRVANNMAFVASLLNMSRRRILSDPAAAPAIIDEARSRIETMARIHRRLHDPSQVDLPIGSYLRDLCSDVIEASGVSGVACDVTVPPMTLDIRKLTTISMLVSEVVTNSLKHAYPAGRTGRITVTLQLRDDDSAMLTIADDGIGLREAPEEAPAGHGLGNRIIEALAKQLKGTIARQSGPGLATRVEFPI
jgi:two-component sensor histidine kinase